MPRQEHEEQHAQAWQADTGNCRNDRFFRGITMNYWHPTVQNCLIMSQNLSQNSLGNHLVVELSITSSHISSLGRCQATPQVRTEVVRIFSSGSVAVQPTATERKHGPPLMTCFQQRNLLQPTGMTPKSVLSQRQMYQHQYLSYLSIHLSN